MPEQLGTSDRQAACPDREELEGWFKPLAEVPLRFLPEGQPLPRDCSEHVFPTRQPATRRSDQIADHRWTAPELWHKPLYFDDLPLEQYGQSVSVPLQPVLSGARFFGTVLIVPYKIGVQGPYQSVTTLGSARPGQYVPCVRERLPLRWRGAWWEAATAVGLVFALP